MDRVIVVVPTEREAAFFASHRLHAHICGVGMAECAAVTAELIIGELMSGCRPDLMILAGVAGTYNDNLTIGDTVVVASETIADLGRAGDGGEKFVPLFQKTYNGSFRLDGSHLPTVRSNTVNTAGCEAARNSEAEIENMEGAAFMAVCERLGVSALEVRTISNRVGRPVTSESLDMSARMLAEALEAIITSL